MSDEEAQLHRQAIEFVKQNSKQLFEELLGEKKFSVSEERVAIFMAGTPGAGKTEVAESLALLFDNPPLRVDADEFRSQIPGYTGTNSNIIQSAASLAVEKVLDQIYAARYPFILDATFAVGKAMVNLKRALRKDYVAQIYFVYQNPVDAWKFTKIREQKEGRRVPREAFINAYFASRENVKKVKDELGDKVLLTLIIKNYETEEHRIYDNIDSVDDHLPKLYTKDELEGLIND